MSIISRKQFKLNHSSLSKVEHDVREFSVLICMICVPCYSAIVVSSLTGAIVRVPKVNVDLCNSKELLSAHCMSKSPKYFYEYYSADFPPPHKPILTCAGSQILNLGTKVLECSLLRNIY
jgi:hypothetical protein